MIYVFCLNVPEIALPLILVTQLHASQCGRRPSSWPTRCWWSPLQVPVTAFMSRFPRRTVLALAGVVLALSYLGFPRGGVAGTRLGRPGRRRRLRRSARSARSSTRAAPPRSVTALAPARVLGRTLARFELSTGLGLAVSPAAITALAPHGPAALWGTLTAATLAAASLPSRGR